MTLVRKKNNKREYDQSDETVSILIDVRSFFLVILYKENCRKPWESDVPRKSSEIVLQQVTK